MIVHAELEQRRECIVKIDAQKFAAHFYADRARFTGTDEEFVLDWLKAVPDDVMGGEYDGMPFVTVEYGGFNDDVEVNVLGIVAA